MARRLARSIPWLLLALISCSEQHRPAVEDSQTHWLRSCESSNSCGAGMDCICGRCVVTCQEHACSVPDRETQCVQPQTDALQSLCGAQVSEVAVCLESCAADTSCADGQQCIDGACVPTASRAGCEVSGVLYEPGAQVPSGDCNTCTCNGDGSLQCTTIACPESDPEPEPAPPPDGCDIGGVHYAPGAPVPTGDCNSCACNADGSVQCTTLWCPPAMPTGCDDNGNPFEHQRLMATGQWTLAQRFGGFRPGADWARMVATHVYEARLDRIVKDRAQCPASS